MEHSDREFGLCPVCGHGHIIKTNRDYVCTNRLRPSSEHGGCRFSIPFHAHGVDITDEMIRQLIKTGATDYMEMSDQKGFPYQGRFIINPGEGYDIESETRPINAVCPNCGGQIIQTRFGYACVNHLAANSLCNFIIPNFICNRYITVTEAEDFCNGHADILDGFLNKQGKWFSAYLTRNENGSVELSSIVGKCPVCGGNLLVGPAAFNCSNYKHGCDFKIWRHYYGHKVNLQDAKELLAQGKSTLPFEAFDKYGHVHALILKVGTHNEIQVTSYNNKEHERETTYF